MKISVRRRGAGGYKIRPAVMFDLETGSNKQEQEEELEVA